MPTPLTDEWIEEQLELCKAASQAPWHDGFDDGSGRISDDDHSGAYITFGELNLLGLPQCVVDGGDAEYNIRKGVLKQEDVDFIIAAREGYSKALKRLRILQKTINDVAVFADARQSRFYGPIFSMLNKLRTDIDRGDKV